MPRRLCQTLKWLADARKSKQLPGPVILNESMDVHKIVAELYEERRLIDEAIAAIEGLVAAGQRRRGRPPKWLTEARKKVEGDPKDKSTPRKK